MKHEQMVELALIVSSVALALSLINLFTSLGWL